MDNIQKKDQKVETVLGNLLLIGVILAAATVLLGGILYLFQHGMQLPEYTTFLAETDILNHFSKVVHGVGMFKSIPIIELGILILIATPVLRVAFSVVAFLYEKDYLYVIFTLIVLVILLISLFI